MGINLNLTIEQKQQLSQSQIQSLEILAMCNMELNTFLNREYQENPLIDYREGTGAEPLEAYYAAYENRQRQSEGYGSEDNYRDFSGASVPAAAGESIDGLIKEQLDPLDYSKAEWKLIEYMIMNLDQNGFYSLTPEETARMAKAPLPMVKRCLNELRNLEPTGIFQPDLAGCLLRQLDAAGNQDETLRRIIQENLDDISKGKISTITRKFSLSSLKVRQYIALIASLTPKPLVGFYQGENLYLVPDLIASNRHGQWEVVLNDNWMGNYRLNEYYIRMIAENNDETLQQYFKEKLERARLVLNSIEQRRRTILDIAHECVVWQEAFLLKKGALTPMTMSDLAEHLDIHVSTVSRAVNGKYIQYPHGTILMKDLFSGKAAAGTGAKMVSASQIKMLIKELIAGEDRKNPYSDQKLTELLKEKEIAISRRVVAKYRDELNIKGSFDRKEHKKPF